MPREQEGGQISVSHMHRGILAMYLILIRNSVLTPGDSPEHCLSARRLGKIGQAEYGAHMLP